MGATPPELPRLPAQASSPTSQAAAAAAAATAPGKRGDVFRFVIQRGQQGATDEEIQNGLMMRDNTQRPRRVELVAAGLVVDSGRTRPTRQNREAVVWIDARLVEGRDPQARLF